MSIEFTEVINNVDMKYINSSDKVDENCKIKISRDEEDNFGFPVDKEDIYDETADSNFALPFVGQKFGRHQLHPFSTKPMLAEGIKGNNEEFIMNIEILDCTKGVEPTQTLSIDDGSLSDTALPHFPIVSSKPGRHQIHPFSTSNTISSTGSKSVIDVQKCDDPVGAQNKRVGTLSRVIKGVKSPNKDDKSEKDVYDKSANQKDVPLHQEGTNPKTTGVLGKMLTKVNNVSKESKSNISNAIHRLSDVLIGGFKTDKRDDRDKSDISLKMSSKAKSASLGRKGSDITSNFSKENLNNEKLYEGKSKTLNNRSDHCLTESNLTGGKSKKDLTETNSKLFNRLSSISTHLRFKQTPVGETIIDHSVKSVTKIDE